MTDGVRERVLAIVAVHLGKQATEVSAATEVDLHFDAAGLPADELLAALSREFGTEFLSEGAWRDNVHRAWHWPVIQHLLVPAAGVLAAALALWIFGSELNSRIEKLLGAVVFILIVWIFRPRRPEPQPSVERVTVGRLIASVRRGMN